MEYHVVILPTAEADLEKLPGEVRAAVISLWTGFVSMPRAILRRLHNLPDDLFGLCRLRHSDYRILYWHDRRERTIKVYRVQHRSEVYRDL